MKLYEIANEYQQAFDALSEIEGLSHEVIADSLAAIGAEFEEKAKAVAAHIQNLEAEAQQIREAEQRMSIRHDKIADKVNVLRKYLLTNMKACNSSKISTAEFAVSIRKNPPKVIIEEDLLDRHKWCKTKIIEEAPDISAIKAALISGIEITGARLEQDERLHFE